MNIGLDFDGVITNIGELKSLLAKKLFNKEIPANKFNSAYVLENNILSKEEYDLIKNTAYCSDISIKLTKPVDRSIENINKLISEGHNLKIITARSGDMLYNAKKWLKMNRLQIPIIGVGFGKSKKESVQDMDVFVDDFLLQLYYMSDVVPHRFLFSWGYNEMHNEKGWAVRVYDWDELYNFINNIKR